MPRISSRVRGGLVAAWVLGAAAGRPPAAGGEEREPTPEEIGAIQIYATADESIREVFDGVARVDTVVVVLDDSTRAAVAALCPSPVPSDTVAVLVPRGAASESLGYAMIVEEAGKYRPITFLVGLDPDLDVRGVEVLVYRESRGGEVRRTRFLRQYRGKDVESPIRINRDILNVAGATISVNAMNHGVKRVLATVHVLTRRGRL